MRKLELFYPVKPWLINQEFGVNGIWYRANGINIDGHGGLDARSYSKQPCYASHDGIVVYAGVDNLEGYGVVVKTEEKYDYKDTRCHFKTVYWHLLPYLVVQFGQKVKVGQLLGYCDNTGFSSGDHLHFALKPVDQIDEWNFSNLEQNNGYNGAIDPTSYFNGMYAEDIKQIISIQRLLVVALQKLLKLLTR